MFCVCNKCRRSPLLTPTLSFYVVCWLNISIILAVSVDLSVLLLCSYVRHDASNRFDRIALYSLDHNMYVKYSPAALRFNKNQTLAYIYWAWKKDWYEIYYCFKYLILLAICWVVLVLLHALSYSGTIPFLNRTVNYSTALYMYSSVMLSTLLFYRLLEQYSTVLYRSRT